MKILEDRLRKADLQISSYTTMNNLEELKMKKQDELFLNNDIILLKVSLAKKETECCEIFEKNVRMNIYKYVHLYLC